MDTHRQINKLLAAFSLGELSAQQTWAVEKHIAVCQQCGAELKRLSALVESTEQIRNTSADVEACEYARKTTMAGIGREEKLRPTPTFIMAVMKSRITKFAVAAMIIIAVGFFLIERNWEGQTEKRFRTPVTKNPAKMLTVGSATRAYRRGGMEAVEKQIKKAFIMLGPRTTSIPYEDLI